MVVVDLIRLLAASPMNTSVESLTSVVNALALLVPALPP